MPSERQGHMYQRVLQTLRVQVQFVDFRCTRQVKVYYYSSAQITGTLINQQKREKEEESKREKPERKEEREIEQSEGANKGAVIT